MHKDNLSKRISDKDTEFITALLSILCKYLTERKIVSKTKEPNETSNIKKIETIALAYWSDLEISTSKKEEFVAKWIERYLNDLEIFDYDLDKFSLFYSEIDDYLSKYSFGVEEFEEYSIYYKIVTPSDKLEKEELLKIQNEWNDKDRCIEEQNVTERRDEIVAKHNQRLLVEYIENSQIYLRILREYFDNPEIILANEKLFAKTVANMKSQIRKISLGIYVLNGYNTENIIPFGSLYSVKEDWNNVNERDATSQWPYSPKIKNREFTYENIESLLTPSRVKISSLISDNYSNNHSSSSLTTSFYIEKETDDFRYKGRLLRLSKRSNYYKVFCALYALRPKGGEIAYDELISEIYSRIPDTKSKSAKDMKKFIQSNLTDKSNGFLRKAKIPETEDNSRPLVAVIKGVGIHFNNKAG